jgi:dUTP pyrophosphatase
VATSCEEIAPNVYKYGIGLAFQIEREGMPDFINMDIDFRPRSSVWKTGLVLSNCTGTIDELYRGEVSAVFYHVMPAMPKYELGDRIGQIKLGMTLPMEFVEVDELSETERGAGGYGSTGK